ncbi:hypothetical protein ABBQ38_010484 [Trebouxia sp. C0009 RCD-2024]
MPAMAFAVPDAAPKLVSKGTQTLQWKSNRPTLTARQALANQAHSTRCAAHGKPLLQPKHGSTSRQENVVAGASKTAQKRQSNTSSAWSQNEDPNLPDASHGSQVEQQYRQTLAASRREMDMQLAECQHLREDLRQHLQYIQQTLTQLDDKEAHLKTQFQALLNCSNFGCHMLTSSVLEPSIPT